MDLEILQICGTIILVIITIFLLKALSSKQKKPENDPTSSDGESGSDAEVSDVGVLKSYDEIPGPSETPDPELGHMAVIKEHGGIIDFLLAMHKQHGDIFKFFLGKEEWVSLSAPDGLKTQANLFDRAVGVFRPFEPLIGPNSIQYANGPEGQKRRKLHDRAYSHASVSRKIPLFQEVADAIVESWKEAEQSGKSVPLSETFFTSVLQVLTRFAFGDHFKQKEALLKFKECYDNSVGIMTSTLADGTFTPESKGYDKFQEAISGMKRTVAEIIKTRESEERDPEDKIFIDYLMDEYSNTDMIFDDCATYMLGGSHTTSYFLVWCFYRLCLNPDVVEKLHVEISEVFGDDDKLRDIQIEDIAKLKYMECVINEVLRVSDLGPFSTRNHETDTPLLGYYVPNGTPVFQCHSAMFRDETIYPNHERFNPDRFLKPRPAFSFEPFGFAGKRKCPGYRLTLMEAYVFLIVLVRHFKVSLVPGQTVIPIHGITCIPAEEIMMNVASR